MLMNVLYLLTTVIKTQSARILMDHSCALVSVDIMEMELFAMVREMPVLLNISRKRRIVHCKNSV